MAGTAALLPGEVLLLTVAAVAAIVCLAFALRRGVRAYLDFRGTRVTICPATGTPAAVELDPLEAATAVVSGRAPELRIATCSRWPEHAHCGQECLEQIAQAPMACLARTMLISWYGGKTCALCGKAFGEIEWFTHRPALRAPGGTTLEWAEVRAELLPDVLETHSPVCWNCHIAESFRAQHPDLVTDRPWKRESGLG
jgi:hypothetical protein